MLVVVWQGVAQVAADGRIDLRGPGVVRFHQGLDGLQLLGGGGGLVQLDPRPGSQLDDAVLAEVLHAAADVAAPLVPHGARGRVHGDEGQLVQPAGDAAVPVHIARRLAGAHGDAQDVVVVQAHGPRQGGDVAVVGYGIGHVAEGVGDGPDIDVLDLRLIEVLGDFEEEGGHHGPVVDVDPGGADAHRVHPGHVGGGGLQGGDDAVVVIVGVRVDLGQPDDLLGEDRLAVDDGGDLPVGAARVEADAAALQMAAHGLGGVMALGDGVRQHHLEGMLVDPRHEVPVELPLPAPAVDGAEVVIDAPVVHVDPEAALHPQGRLHQAVDVVPVRLRLLRRAVDEGPGGGDLPVRALYGDGHGLFRGLQEGGVEPQDGDELRIELGDVLDLDGDAETFHRRSS